MSECEGEYEGESGGEGECVFMLARVFVLACSCA